MSGLRPAIPHQRSRTQHTNTTLGLSHGTRNHPSSRNRPNFVPPHTRYSAAAAAERPRIESKRGTIRSCSGCSCSSGSFSRDRGEGSSLYIPQSSGCHIVGGNPDHANDDAFRIPAHPNFNLQRTTHNPAARQSLPRDARPPPSVMVEDSDTIARAITLDNHGKSVKS